jgi:NADPH:quinone reductase-like Zn-dependent oxidoreductase
MKAMVQDRYGSPDVLAFREVAQPVPRDGEVLVRVRAASVNARDWHFLRGDPYLARLFAPELGLRRPGQPIRGTDFAGEVVAVGRGVTRLAPGSTVYGECAGAIAEYVCAPQDVVDDMPANLSFEEAAALPLAANTALVALRDKASVRPGQRVLVNGASGGVGLFAVQLAHAYGASVTAVCSTRNIGLVRDAGADAIVDYTRTDFARTGERYDVVLDLVANRSLADLRRATTPRGTLVIAGGGVSKGGSLVGPMALVLRATAAAPFARQRIVVAESKPSVANLAAIRELAEAGVLRPVIDRTYPMEKAAEAIRYLEVEHARAKVVLTVA